MALRAFWKNSLADEFARVAAVDVTHKTGTDDAIPQKFLHTLAIVAGDMRRHSQHHVFNLPQPGLAILRRDRQPLGVRRIGATAVDK